MEIFSDPSVSMNGMRSMKVIETIAPPSDPFSDDGKITRVTSALHWNFAFLHGSFETICKYQYEADDESGARAISFELVQPGFLKEFRGFIRCTPLEDVADLASEGLCPSDEQLLTSLVKETLAGHASGSDSVTTAGASLGLVLVSYEQFMRPALGLPGLLRGRLDALAESNVVKLFGAIHEKVRDPCYVPPSARAQREALRRTDAIFSAAAQASKRNVDTTGGTIVPESDHRRAPDVDRDESSTMQVKRPSDSDSTFLQLRSHPLHDLNEWYHGTLASIEDELEGIGLGLGVHGVTGPRARFEFEDAAANGHGGASPAPPMFAPFGLPSPISARMGTPEPGPECDPVESSPCIAVTPTDQSPRPPLKTPIIDIDARPRATSGPAAAGVTVTSDSHA